MIIILEGSDKTGKSTLAKYIRAKYDFDYIKCSRPKGDPYIEYMEILQKIATTGGNWVIDRFLIGESVYGPIYRGESKLDDVKIRNIELKALSLNPLLIYCYDDVKNIKKRFKELKEDFAKTKDIEKILELYEEQVEKSILPCTFHHMMTPLDLIKTKRIDFIIEKLMDRGVYFNTVTGNTKNPAVIFVGESRNENQKKEYKKVGQPFDFGPASKYLFKKIKETGNYIHKILIINSDSEEFKVVIERFDNPNEIKRPKIIALGKKANNMLNILNIKHDLLPHPQYMNRFYPNDDVYSFLLKRI